MARRLTPYSSLCYDEIFLVEKKEYVWFEPTELLVQNRAITIGNFRNGDALDRWISVYS